MGDRAMCHIRLGGDLPRSKLPELQHHIETYGLLSDWGGEPVDTEIPLLSEPLDLYGEELNGGLVPDLEKFCVDNALPFWRWSGGCGGAFEPELYANYGPSDQHYAQAADSEDPVFTAQDVNKANSLDDLKAILANFERELPPFRITGDIPAAIDQETANYLAEARERALTGFPLSRITEAFYLAQLNCLPPVYKRNTPGFFICEAYTDNVHAQFIEHRGAHYAAYVDVTDKASIVDYPAINAFHDEHSDDKPLTWYPDLSKVSEPT